MSHTQKTPRTGSNQQNTEAKPRRISIMMTNIGTSKVKVFGEARIYVGNVMLLYGVIKVRSGYMKAVFRLPRNAPKQVVKTAEALRDELVDIYRSLGLEVKPGKYGVSIIIPCKGIPRRYLNIAKTILERVGVFNKRKRLPEHIKEDFTHLLAVKIITHKAVEKLAKNHGVKTSVW